MSFVVTERVYVLTVVFFGTGVGYRNAYMTFLFGVFRDFRGFIQMSATENDV